MFMYLTIVRWLSHCDKWSSRLAASTAVFTFAFSPLIWMYAIGAEVFSLNNLFASSLLFVLVCYADNQTFSIATFGAFLSGLALTNQHTIVLFEIPIVSWVLWTKSTCLSLHSLGRLAIAFLFGLLPYVYMPLVSYLRPQPGSWGDLNSIHGFFHHLRRGDYGTFRLFSTDKDTESLTERLVLYFNDLITREGGYIIAPLAILGLMQPIHKAHSVHWTILTMYLVYIIGFHALANMPLHEGLLYGVHMRFWQQPNIIAFIWAGVGLGFLLEKVPHTLLKRFLAIIICLGCTTYQLTTWYTLNDQSNAMYITQYAKALLDPLPKNALVFINYDLQWTSMRYLQRCEHFRSDLTILNLSMMTYKWFGTKHVLYPHISFPGSYLVPASLSQNGGFNLMQLIDANYNKFRKSGIFLGGQLNYKDPNLFAKYSLVPFGLLDKFHPNGKPVYKSIKKWYRSTQKTLDIVHTHLPTLPPEHLYNDQTWEWTVARDYHMKRLSLATYLLDEAIKSNGSIEILADCTKPMEHSLLYEPRQFWTDTMLKNLGLAYAHIVKSSTDFKPYQKDVLLAHVGTEVADPTKWKDRASTRMLQVWKMWVALPSAKEDPGYSFINDIVTKFN
ncbi:hypothetical protein THRCLA_09555 [Thraustotheca clavata]|uniref:Transmembrane protein n=1 Tax=Thraustotheca clavata TaxID=74557 RepID=A0A1V9YVP8_9STRA|nr:hypothetical protein THRCLA_09555 [Thraustotheca clavata]